MCNYEISTVLGKRYCSDVTNDSTLHTPTIISGSLVVLCSMPMLFWIPYRIRQHVY